MNLESLSCIVPDPEKFMADPPSSPEVWLLPDESIPSIFDLAELDRIIASGLVTDRHVRMTRDNLPLLPSDYAWGEEAPTDRLRGGLKSHTVNRLIRSGATLVLNEVEYYSDAVGDLCRRLVMETGQRATAGAFLTPGSSSGLAAHQDIESVLLIQTHGSKRWQLTASSRPLRLEHEGNAELCPADMERVAKGGPDLDVTLRVGEALWIPRGWIHANKTTHEASLHLTIGFTPYTRYWLAETVMRELSDVLSDGDAFRPDLPWGIADRPQQLEAEVARVVDHVSASLGQLKQRDMSTRISQKMNERFLAPRRSHPILTAIGPDVELDTPVVLVTEAVSRSERLRDGRLVLNLRDTTLTVPAAASDWLAGCLSSDSTAAWSARDMVPALDPTRATKIVTTLIRQGVARPLSRQP